LVSRLNASTVSKCISSMTGDLQGSIFAGGIIGGYGLQHSTTNVVNAMTGNIVNTGTNTTSEKWKIQILPQSPMPLTQ